MEQIDAGDKELKVVHLNFSYQKSFFSTHSHFSFSFHSQIKRSDDLNDEINAHKSLESIQSKWYLQIEASA